MKNEARSERQRNPSCNYLLFFFLFCRMTNYPPEKVSCITPPLKKGSANISMGKRKKIATILLYRLNSRPPLFTQKTNTHGNYPNTHSVHTSLIHLSLPSRQNRDGNGTGQLRSRMTALGVRVKMAEIWTEFWLVSWRAMKYTLSDFSYLSGATLRNAIMSNPESESKNCIHDESSLWKSKIIGRRTKHLLFDFNVK